MGGSAGTVPKIRTVPAPCSYYYAKKLKADGKIISPVSSESVESLDTKVVIIPLLAKYAGLRPLLFSVMPDLIGHPCNMIISIFRNTHVLDHAIYKTNRHSNTFFPYILMGDDEKHSCDPEGNRSSISFLSKVSRYSPRQSINTAFAPLETYIFKA